MWRDDLREVSERPSETSSEGDSERSSGIPWGMRLEICGVMWRDDLRGIDERLPETSSEGDSERTPVISGDAVRGM